MPLKPESPPQGGVSAAEFNGLISGIADFETNPRILVAVSGGSDSMALLHLAADWTRQMGGTAHAVTIDHGIRAQSRAEAQQVGDWARQLSIPHQIVTLDRQLVNSRSVDQDWLRRLRYRALATVARELGILHLLTAHHQGDQAETLLIRLGRGSGIVGLSAMQPRQFTSDYQILRPLLGISAARLRETCFAAKQEWVTDPSNHNPHYLRVRLRQAAPMLAELGLTELRLAETAELVAAGRDLLGRLRDRFLADYGYFHPAGFVRLSPGDWSSSDPLILREVMVKILAQVGGGDYPPRAERLDRLLGHLVGTENFDCCLGGCRLVKRSVDLLIFRELVAMSPPEFFAGTDGIVTWDNRFRLSWRGEITGRWSIGGLAINELKDWRSRLLSAGIPRRIMVTLPVIRRDGVIIHIPHSTETMSDSPFFVEPI